MTPQEVFIMCEELKGYILMMETLVVLCIMYISMKLIYKIFKLIFK